MSKRVTIKTIADDLGISHMTVSRALAGHPNVLQKTRDTVQKRARELGYVRNAAARAMRGELSPIIGVLVPNITNDFYARFANSLAEKSKERGLQLIINLTRDDVEAEKEALIGLEELQARAVIMVPTAQSDLTATNDRSMKRIQLIRRAEGSADLPSVLVDDHKAICQAVVQLADRGHRSIAFIGATQDFSSGRARLRSFKEGLAQCQLSPIDALMRTVSPSFEAGYAAAQSIINAGIATAVVCGGFELSNGALKAAIQSGVLGEKVEFVGYGDPDFYSWIDGGLSTIRVPVSELVDCALERVFEAENFENPVDYRFEAKLVAR